MMTDITSIADADPSILTAWPSLEPDRYLDARRPAWEPSERARLVRYVRLRDERNARVYIDPAATEIIEALFTPPTAESGTGDPQLVGARPAEGGRP